MTLADYLISKIISMGVKDIFGIPGGVVLDFLYALKKRKEITGHLLFHEQDAAYAAVGYAQSGHRLGIAFATKGPGVLNMVTTVADAYHDSVPILVITSHGTQEIPVEMRVKDEQELDLRRIFSSISKAVVVIDELDSAEFKINEACNLAIKNRKGPVVLDVYAKLWKNMLPSCMCKVHIKQLEITNRLKKAKRPVILIGSGVRQADIVDSVRGYAERNGIPVLSSRGSQDVMADSNMYFGYIGSHGIRYANFILSKGDCILSLGNRLAFPVESKSFGKIFEHANLIRLEIDENELKRNIPGSITYLTDLVEFKSFFEESNLYKDYGDWISVCSVLRKKLWEVDVNEPVRMIAKIMKKLYFAPVMISDVGNNEFWVSRAYVYAKQKNIMQYSRSLGVLGNALGKAIGAYYSCRKPIVCFCGDQGAQYNISELQYISENNLPIWLLVINNHSSGMIRMRQRQKYNGEYMLTTKSTGYSVVDFSEIAKAYKINYVNIKHDDEMTEFLSLEQWHPHLIEIDVPEDVELEPCLPIGKEIQDMVPALDSNLYKMLNDL